MPIKYEVRGLAEEPARECGCESSLDVGHGFHEPCLQGLDKVKKALESDASRLKKTYGSVEPKARTSRYTVELPKQPQHEKYCHAQRRLSVGSRPESRASVQTEQGSLDTYVSQEGAEAGVSAPPPAKYSLQTLERWFQELDCDGLGVSQRLLILKLRRRRSVRGFVLRIHGVTTTEDTAVRDVARPRAPELLHGREISRLTQIFAELDEDGTGTLQWPEFVEFFRRSGLLVEYRTEDAPSSAATSTATTPTTEDDASSPAFAEAAAESPVPMGPVGRRESRLFRMGGLHR